MSSDSNEAGQSASAKKKRSRVEKLVVRGGIAVLAIAVLVEAMSQRSYNATLTRVMERLKEDESAQKETVAEGLQKLVQGLPLKGTIASGDDQIVSLRWPSVFKRYHLEWRVDSEGMVAEVATEPTLAERRATMVPTLVPPAVPSVPPGRLMVSAQRFSDPALLRELVRQSVFLCGRESFGLSGIEELSRETQVTQPESGQAGVGKESFKWPLRLSIRKWQADRSTSDFNVSAEIRVQQPNGDQLIFSESVSGPVGELVAILASTSEGWSRKEFVDVLSKAGFDRRELSADAGVNPAVVDEATAELMLSLNPVSQVLAIRALSRESGQSTPSVEVATAMARSYALLGSLIESHWSTMHKSLKARGLLLVERAVRDWPESRLAWQSRAYVRALAGLHDLALADLEQANSLGDGESPEWAEGIRVFCSWNGPRLEQLALKKNPLAMYLALLHAEIAGTPGDKVEASQRLLKADADCWRAMATLSQAGGVGIGHFVNSAGMDGIHQGLSRLLSQTDDLPALVAPLLSVPASPPSLVGQVLGKLSADREGNHTKAIILALNDASLASAEVDSPLSWGVTATIIEDAIFQLAIETLRFQRFSLGVDSEPLLSKMTSLLEGHPLVAAIECFHEDDTKFRAAVSQLAEKLPFVDLSGGAMGIYNALAWRDYRLVSVYNRTSGQLDDVVPDRAWQWQHMENDVAALAASNLLQLGSNCSLIPILNVKGNWELSRDRAAEWENKYSDNVALLRELAVRYEQDSCAEETERCLKKIGEVTRDPSEMLKLADFYWRRGESEKQRESLLATLKLPANGLEHATASSRLAYGLMSKGEWTEAKPHALSAADSYSHFGLLCAADCYEGLENWSKSEEFHQAASERYTDAGTGWYFWCRRTGHGDLRRARRLAQQTLDGHNDLSEDELSLRKAVFAKLEGKTEEAYRLMLERTQKYRTAYDSYLAAVWASELGLTDERDKLLRGIFEANDRMCECLLAKLVLKALNRESGSPDDETLTFCLLTDMKGGNSTNNMFFIAESLRMLGEEERAVKWYALCQSSPMREKLTTTLAGARLTELGIPAKSRRPRELDDVDPRVVWLFQLPEAHISKRAIVWLERCRQAASLSPNLAAIHYVRGLQASGQNEFDEAEMSLTKVLELGPPLAEIYLARGEVYRQLGDPLKAIADYRSALKLAPKDFAVLSYLAWLLATHPDDEVRDISEARRYADLLRKHPLNEESFGHILDAVFAADDGQFEKALQLRQAAVDAAPPAEKNNYNYHELYYKNRMPFRQKPVFVPLLSQIPADGTWARYRVTVTENEQKRQGTVEVRAVGSLENEGEALRAIEIELRSEDGDDWAITYRILVPKDACGYWKHPMRKVGTVWSLKGGEVVEHKPGDAARVELLEWFAGATMLISRQGIDETIDGPRGPVRTQVFVGTSLLDPDGSRRGVSWKIRKSEELPFAVANAWAQAEGDTLREFDITLEEFGNGAKDSMPALVP